MSITGISCTFRLGSSRYIYRLSDEVMIGRYIRHSRRRQSSFFKGTDAGGIDGTSQRVISSLNLSRLFS